MSAFNFNQSTVAAQVKAAFTVSIKDSVGQTTSVLSVLKNLVTTPYEYGLFAEQDIRVLFSMVYSLRNEIVSLMYVADRPLQDQSQEGSLESNDTGREDEQAVERAAAIAEAVHELVVLERHIESLDKQAASDLEEAGAMHNDGGRKRFMRRTQQYRSYVNTTYEWLLDQKAEATSGSIWLMKLEAFEEMFTVDVSRDPSHPKMEFHLPHVDAQTATEEYRQYLADDRLDRSSYRAWDNVLDTLETIGRELHRHEQVMHELNLDLASLAGTSEQDKAKAAVIKTEMATETKLHRENMRTPIWLLTKRLEPVALLAHTGVPKSLIESTEWRTEEATIRAREAQAKAAQVNAQMLEMQANMAELQANTMLLEMQKQMADMQAQFNEQMAAFKSLAQAKPAKPAKLAKPVKAVSKTADEAQCAPAFEPTKSQSQTISLTSGIKQHTTRGVAGNFRPRG